MKKFFSLRAIAQKSILLTERFPISILLIAGLAFLCFIDISKEANYIPYQLYIFFSFGFIISVAVTLWLEDFVRGFKQYIIIAAVTLLWGIYCFFLPFADELEVNKIVELSVIGMVAFLAMFFVSFLKKDKDKAFWKFTMQMVFQLGLTYCFGAIIFIGLFMSIWAIQNLFDIDITELYEYSGVFCYVLFAPLYFLANIPDKIAKHNEEIALGKILKILALYILTPIAAIYAAILYVYLFKIIAIWKLPEGSVSYMVSSLMGLGLLIITLLYPARFSLCRYSGLVMLPLLALMSIGIFRRFDDYGLTIHRGYVLLLNIWFYGICIYLFITKAQRIKWIVISFAAIALLVSIGPWSVPSVTKYILTAEVSKHLDFAQMETKDKEKIKDKVMYLRRTYGGVSIQGLDTNIFSELEIKKTDNSGWFHNNSKWNNEILDIENFNTFVYVTNYDGKGINKNIDSSIDENNQLIIKIIPEDKQISSVRIFSVPLRGIVQATIAEKNKKLFFQGDDYIVFINRINGHYYKTADNISIDVVNGFEGYLFYNR